MRNLRLFGWLVAIALIIACTKAEKNHAKTSSLRPSSNTRQDALVLALGSEPASGFDPTTGWGRYGSPLFQSTLLARDNDLQLVNDLSTQYSVSADGLTWTIQIRPDVQFSDGGKLTTEDVVYTYETAKKSGSVVDLTVLESVQATSPLTVVFKLKHPQSTFVDLLASLGIVPKAKHDNKYATNPIGSGPYKLVQYDKGQQLIVAANPYYYKAKPAFSKITFLFMSEDAIFAAAKAGKIDVAAIPASLADQEVAGMKLIAVSSVDNRGIMFPMVSSRAEKTAQGYNLGNDITSDLAIRRAVNLAIDRKKLVQGVLLGHGMPAFSSCDNLPWSNPQSIFTDADIPNAKKILSAEGWKDSNNDQILEKNNKKAIFNLVYPAGDQIRQSLALAVADQVKPLGIVIKVIGKSWDDIQRLKHANAVLFGWGSHDPMEVFNIHSSSTIGRGWWNPGYYSNKVADSYMSLALRTTDKDLQNQLWQKAQWDGTTGFGHKDGDVPWVWLVNLDHCYLVSQKLDTGKQRIEPHGHGWPITANITEWHWSTVK